MNPHSPLSTPLGIGGGGALKNPGGGACGCGPADMEGEVLITSGCGCSLLSNDTRAWGMGPVAGGCGGGRTSVGSLC